MLPLRAFDEVFVSVIDATMPVRDEAQAPSASDAAPPDIAPRYARMRVQAPYAKF